MTVVPLKVITPGIFTHTLQKVSTKRKVAVFIVEALGVTIRRGGTLI